MPVLKTLRKKSEVKLPESGGTVLMYDQFLTGDYRHLMKDGKVTKDSQDLDIGTSFEFLLRLIAEWDFTNEDGTPLSLNIENLDLLPIADLNVLASKVGEVSAKSTINVEVKKN